VRLSPYSDFRVGLSAGSPTDEAEKLACAIVPAATRPDRYRAADTPRTYMARYQLPRHVQERPRAASKRNSRGAHGLSGHVSVSDTRTWPERSVQPAGSQLLRLADLVRIGAAVLGAGCLEHGR